MSALARGCAWGLALCGLVLVAPGAAGQSLFKKDQNTKLAPQLKRKPAESLFNDPVVEKKVWQKHDLITIMVVESTQSNIRTNTQVRKETTLEAELNNWIRLQRDGKSLHRWKLKNATLPTPTPKMDFEAEYERIGSGQARRQFTLKAAITAEVVKVLPNGNLVIEARKTRQVDDDKETMVLSGVVRPDDVSKTNSVLSQRVARLTYRYIGRGTTYDAQKAGLLGKVAEWLWPF